MSKREEFGQDSYIINKSEKDSNSNNKSFSKVIRYHFDNSIAKGSNFVFYLLILAVLCGLLMTIIQYFTGSNAEGTFYDKWWNSVSEILKIGAGENWSLRLIKFLFWALGIAFSGAVIGFLTSKIQQVIEVLKKGKSDIISTNHIVIIGWSENISSVLKELSIANESEKGTEVVIFSSIKNETMQESISINKKMFSHISIVTRSGDATSPEELAILNLNESRSIILLNELGDSAQITTLLSVISVLDKKNLNIIISLANKSFYNVIAGIKGFNIIPVMADEITANITAQVCRFRGLGIILLDFLDFDGDEIYFSEEKELVGQTYGSSALRFTKSSIIGLKKSDGKLLLNPKSDTVIQKGDLLILVSEDNSAIKVDRQLKSDYSNIVTEDINLEEATKHILFLGWSKIGIDIMTSYAPFLSSNSSVDIAYVESLVDAESLSYDSSEFILNKIKMKNETSDILELLNKKAYEEVVLLANTENSSSDSVDTSTLLKMLLLDSNKSEIKNNNFRVIAQLIDSTKAKLAESTFSEELVVSDNLAALYISQLIENSHLREVFEELFRTKGATINIYNVTKYVDLSKPHTYEDLVYSAGLKNESAIGLRIGDETHSSQSLGVKLNPSKDDILSLTKSDSLIVISEN